MAELPAVTDTTFDQEVLQASVPVLVDFWAPWCGPCRMAAPILHEAAKKYEGKAKVVQLNVDECPEVASRYGIRSIPSLFLFNKGQLVDQAIGVQPAAQIAAMLDDVL
jgi:thioredoxin 1